MAVKVPLAARTQVPGRATPVQGVDLAGASAELSRFSAKIQNRVVAEAESRAALEGQRSGAGAYAAGQALKIDTGAQGRAQRAYNKAASATYMARMEIDISNATKEFKLKWDSGEYDTPNGVGDYNKWEAEYLGRINSLTELAPPEIYEAYRGRISDVTQNTTSSVNKDFRDKTREVQRADLGLSMESLSEGITRAFQNGDVDDAEQKLNLADKLIRTSVEGRVIKPYEAAKMTTELEQLGVYGATLGGYRELPVVEREEYINNFRENPPRTMWSKYFQRAVSEMESLNTKDKASFVKTEGQKVLEALQDQRDISGMDYDTMMNFVRENVGLDNPYGAEIRDYVETKISGMIARDRQEKTWLKEQVQSEAWSFAQSVRDSGGEMPETWQDFVAMDESGMVAQAEGQTQKGIMDFLRGKKIETDWGVYGNLQQQFIGDPDRFVDEVNIANHRGELSDTEYKHFWNLKNRYIEMRDRAKTAREKERAKDRVATTEQHIAATAKEHGFKDKALGEYKKGVYRAIRDYENIHDQTITEEKEVEIINALAIKGEYGPNIFQGERLGDLTIEEAAEWSMDDATDDTDAYQQAKAIVQARIPQGQPVKESEVLREATKIVKRRAGYYPNERAEEIIRRKLALANPNREITDKMVTREWATYVKKRRK